MKKNKQTFISKKPLIADFIGSSVNYRQNFGGGRKQDIAKAVGIKSRIRPNIIINALNNIPIVRDPNRYPN